MPPPEHFGEHSRIVSVKPRAHNRSISLAYVAKSHLTVSWPGFSIPLTLDGR
jgi:hypothetical protein